MTMNISHRNFRNTKPSLAHSLLLMTIPFLVAQAYAANKSATEPTTTSVPEQQKPHFTLPPLPFEDTALEPHITKKTLEFHYGKHHKAYLDKLNSLLEDKGNKKTYKEKSLEEIVILSGQAIRNEKSKNANDIAIFNSSAQTWNHTFYWQSMKKGGGGEPTGILLEQIKRDFGSYGEFKKKFVEAGINQFGSGWVWLVRVPENKDEAMTKSKDSPGSLKIISTGNADNPLVEGFIPLLTCDVWEHAYYLDYQNRRKDYVEVFLDHLVNWEFAQERFKLLQNHSA